MTFGITNNNSIVSEWYLNSGEKGGTKTQESKHSLTASVFGLSACAVNLNEITGMGIFSCRQTIHPALVCRASLVSNLGKKAQIHVFMVVRDGCESGCRWFWRFSVFFFPPGNDRRKRADGRNGHKQKRRKLLRVYLCGYPAVFSVFAASDNMLWMSSTEWLSCGLHKWMMCTGISTSNASFSRAFSPTDSHATSSNIQPLWGRSKKAHIHRTSDNKNNGHDRHMGECPEWKRAIRPLVEAFFLALWARARTTATPPPVHKWRSCSQQSQIRLYIRVFVCAGIRVSALAFPLRPPSGSAGGAFAWAEVSTHGARRWKPIRSHIEITCHMLFSSDIWIWIKA